MFLYSANIFSKKDNLKNYMFANTSLLNLHYIMLFPVLNTLSFKCILILNMLF